MKKLERLGDATSPDGSTLTLFRHDGAYVIKVDGVELMSTRRHNSEDLLAELACTPLREQRDARVLIGGLGLGFTLREALRILPADARVEVAELMEEVIAWNMNPEYGLAGEALRDPRVTLRRGDVANLLRNARGVYDAIMMDVDNGSDPLTTAGNAQLYRARGIAAAVSALRPGGQLLYWSDQVDTPLHESLENAGLMVQVVRARAHATSGPWHAIYVARRA
jgi:spermidine synthase